MIYIKRRFAIGTNVKASQGKDFLCKSTWHRGEWDAAFLSDLIDFRSGSGNRFVHGGTSSRTSFRIKLKDYKVEIKQVSRIVKSPG